MLDILHAYLILFPKIGKIILPAKQVRKARFRKVKQFAQSHGCRQKQIQISSVADSESCTPNFLSHFLFKMIP